MVAGRRSGSRRLGRAGRGAGPCLRRGRGAADPVGAARGRARAGWRAPSPGPGGAARGRCRWTSPIPPRSPPPPRRCAARAASTTWSTTPGRPSARWSPMPASKSTAACSRSISSGRWRSPGRSCRRSPEAGGSSSSQHRGLLLLALPVGLQRLEEGAARVVRRAQGGGASRRHRRAAGRPRQRQDPGLGQRAQGRTAARMAGWTRRWRPAWTPPGSRRRILRAAGGRARGDRHQRRPASAG